MMEDKDETDWAPLIYFAVSSLMRGSTHTTSSVAFRQDISMVFSDRVTRIYWRF